MALDIIKLGFIKGFAIYGSPVYVVGRHPARSRRLISWSKFFRRATRVHKIELQIVKNCGFIRLITFVAFHRFVNWCVFGRCGFAVVFLFGCVFVRCVFTDIRLCDSMIVMCHYFCFRKNQRRASSARYVTWCSAANRISSLTTSQRMRVKAVN